MNVERIKPFLWRSIKYNFAKIHSPTIDEIVDVGEFTYHLYLLFATFNKNRLFQAFQVDDKLDIDEETSNYRILLQCDFSNQICESLSFFVKEQVMYDNKGDFFYVKDGIFFDESNFQEVVEIILSLNGLHEEKSKTPKFRNKKAREMYEKIQKYESEKRSRTALELKDMLSILCSAADNGISVFNVGQLNIYQVYEHWERLNLKESHSRLIGVWQNGFLDDPNKLQEWMVKTKL